MSRPRKRKETHVCPNYDDFRPRTRTEPATPPEPEPEPEHGPIVPSPMIEDGIMSAFNRAVEKFDHDEAVRDEWLKRREDRLR